MSASPPRWAERLPARALGATAGEMLRSVLRRTAALLLVVSGAAGLIPALRASRVEGVRALQSE